MAGQRDKSAKKSATPTHQHGTRSSAASSNGDTAEQNAASTAGATPLFGLSTVQPAPASLVAHPAPVMIGSVGSIGTIGSVQHMNLPGAVNNVPGPVNNVPTATEKDENEPRGAKKKLGANYNNNITESNLESRMGPKLLKAFRTIAKNSTSSAGYYAMLLPIQPVSYVGTYLCDFFPALPKLSITGNLVFVACTLRSAFQLEKENCESNDVILKNFDDKRFYEYMKKRIDIAAGEMKLFAGPVILAEICKVFTIKESKHKEAAEVEIESTSCVFPVGHGGKWGYVASSALCEALQLEEGSIANYAVHAKVMATVLMGLIKLTNDSKYKNLFTEMMTGTGVSKQTFQRAVSINSVGLMMFLMMEEGKRKKIDPYKFVNKVTLHYGGSVVMWEREWKQGFKSNHFTLPSEDNGESAELKRMRLAHYESHSEDSGDSENSGDVSGSDSDDE